MPPSANDNAINPKRNLEILGLSGIFQGIADNKSSGILYSKSGNQEKYIYFRGGNMQMIASPNRPSVLAEAIRKSFGQIDDETVQSIFRQQGETGQPLSAILLEIGAEREFILDLCRFQIGEEIFELFTWPNLQFEFSEEQPPAHLFREDLLNFSIDVNPGLMLMEAAKRLDEWQEILQKFPSLKDIPYIAQDIYEVAPEESHLLGITDGGSDLEEVLASCRLPMFRAMSLLYQMAQKGYINLKNAKELKEMAKFEAFRENIFKCIKMYERAEELGGRDLDTISWLAEAYESCGLIGKTVNKYKELGEVCLQGNDLEGSIKAYLRVITYKEEDLEAHEKYVGVLFQNGQFQEGAHAAIVYARKLAVEDRLKAIQVLEDAYQHNPLSPEILEYMANLHQEADNTIDAIFTYTNLANLYKSRGLFEETISAYQKILNLDNANIDARIELAKTYLLMGYHEEGVAEYKRLGDILRQSGLIKDTFGFNYLINICEKIIEFEPTNLSAREWLADVYIYRQDYEKAKNVLLELMDFLQGSEKPQALVSVLQKLVQIEPQNRQYHRMLADIYHRLKDAEKACQELICIGELASEEGSNFAQGGQKDPAERAYLESLDALKAVLTIDPFSLDVRQKVAELLQQLGRIQDAVEEYKLICNMTKAVQNYHDALTALFHIVELAPEDEVSAFLELGRICERQQKSDLAVNFYKKYALHSLERADFGEVIVTCRRVLAINADDQESQTWRDIAMKVMKD
jgi:tetratricopeptide (TPR) repeat protein